jgi:hypothetical protein
VDGYIGAGILTHFALLVDYPSRMVLYADAAACPVETDSWVRCPLSESRTTPGQMKGAPITVGWDTGASHTVIDFATAARVQTAPGLGASDAPIEETIWMGGHGFNSVQMRTYNLSGARVDVLLGHGFFSRHRVLFDFTDGHVLIEP